MFKRYLLILVILEFCTANKIISQCDLKVILENRKKIDREFIDSTKSPLEKNDIINFKGLKYFEYNENYCLKAIFKRTPYEVPFNMKTTTARSPLYVKYGEISFDLNGKSFNLNLYQNVDHKRKMQYDNFLFLPFTDNTNGKLTYGGGRYIDLPIPSGDTLYLDFNKAYNPYCAYNHNYSCPIPPKENYIDTEIMAGEKIY